MEANSISLLMGKERKQSRTFAFRCAYFVVDSFRN